MNYKYKGFISYRHGGEDEILAKKLHSGIEHYRIPAKLCRMFRHLPKRIRPIYRDNTDLGIGGLHALILEALRESEYLVVVCSERAVTPNAEGKLWVDEEVRQFIAANPNENFRKIIPVFVGEEKDYKRFLLPVLRELETPEGAKALGITLPEICESGYEIIGISAKTSGVPRLINDVSAAILKLRPDDLWQRHRRERKRRLLTYLCGGFIALAAACFGYWDYYMPHAYFYSDYVEINHIPQGIGEELTQDEIRIRNFHYKITKRKHKVQKLEMLNSAGRPVRSVDADLFPPGQLRPVQIFFDSYDNDGNLVKSRRKYDAYEFAEEEWSYLSGGKSVQIRAAGTNGQSLAKLKNSSLKSKLNKDKSGIMPEYNKVQIAGYQYVSDERGRVRDLLFCDVLGFPCSDEFGCYGNRFYYNAEGKITKINFFVRKDGKFEIARRRDGVYAVEIAYDDAGNLAHLVKKDTSGNLRPLTDCFNELFQKYENGNRVEKAFVRKSVRKFTSYRYDNRGNLLEAADYVPGRQKAIARSCYQYDSLGNVIKKSCYSWEVPERLPSDIFEDYFFYGVQEGLILSEDYKIDSNGKIVEIKYYRKSKVWGLFEPDRQHGFLRKKYDARGFLIEEALYDLNGNPRSDDKLGFFENKRISKKNYRYDDRGNKIEESSYKIDRMHSEVRYDYDSVGNMVEACYRHGSKVRFRYDVLGNLLEKSYFSSMKDVKPSSVEKYKYDAFGNCIESKSTSGKRPESLDWQKKYDEYGNLTEVAYYGSNGELSGGAYFRYAYDEYGHLAEKSNHAKNGNVIPGGGVAFTRFKSNLDGNLIEEAYYAADGKTLVKNENGNAISRKRYDEHGRCVEVLYYDETENLCMIESGFSIERYKYDEAGRPVERSYHDTKGNLCIPPKIGYACQRYRYDLDGEQSEVAHYGADGKLIMPRELEGAIVRIRFNHIEERCEAYSYDSNGKLFGSEYVYWEGENYKKQKRDYWVETHKYDDAERIIERSYETIPLFTKEKLVLPKGKPGAVERFFYDEKGRCIRAEYYGKDGKTLIGSKVFE